MASFSTLTVTTPRPRVALVTLNRPAALNAMTDEMIGELHRACDDADRDADVRVLVLTGAGRAFSSGLDVSEADRLIHATPATRLETLTRWSRSIAVASQISTPVIAAIDGHAAGGGLALALAADFRIATTDARLSAAFIRIGFTGADMGVSWFLPRIVGLGYAADLMMTGRTIDAAEAARIGLVNQVVVMSGLLDAAYDYADLLAGNDPVSVALTKRALHTNVDAPSLPSALDLENRNQALVADGGAVREALSAFRKRKSR